MSDRDNASDRDNVSDRDIALEMQAYRNGEWMPFRELTIPVTDAGFIQGLTVAEQLRTFGGRLFRLQDHLQRLRESLEIVGVELPVTWESLEAAASALVKDNHALLPEGSDLGLSIFVTPGPYGAYAWDDSGPIVAMHTTPLAFSTWSAKYAVGQPLSTVSVRQVPVECWPAALKCRSRMHYFLADREARSKDPESRALLLDIAGQVTEASTANVVFFFPNEGLVTPPADSILPGISMATLEDLAKQAGYTWVQRPLRPEEILGAEEILLSSTSICMLPVLRLDGQVIGAGSPGRVYQQLLADWSTLVGLDIRDQALRFSA